MLPGASARLGAEAEAADDGAVGVGALGGGRDAAPVVVVAADAAHTVRSRYPHIFNGADDTPIACANPRVAPHPESAEALDSTMRSMEVVHG